MSNTPRVFAEAYRNYSGKFSIASLRGSNTLDLWVIVSGAVASYKTELNGETLYNGSCCAEAAEAYNDAFSSIFKT